MPETALELLIRTNRQIMIDSVKDAYLEALNSCGVYGMSALDMWEQSVAYAFCKDVNNDAD